MAFRYLNRVTSAVIRIPGAIKGHVSNPKNIVQCREMSKKKDGTCDKERCTSDGQFFIGCFKKVERKKCPEVKPKSDARCGDKCKDGPCKPGK